MQAGELREQPRIAGVLVSKAEIFADENQTHGHLLEKNFPDKVLRRDLRKLQIEMQNQGRIQPGAAETFQPLREGGNPRRRNLRTQNLERRRIKRQHGCHGAGRPGPLHHIAENFLMAEMETVEIPDGEHASGSARAEARHPFPRRMQHFERHQMCTSRVMPSYASCTWEWPALRSLSLVS